MRHMCKLRLQHTKGLLLSYAMDFDFSFADNFIEPSDSKSPKEEERMVSPSSCMQVLPLGGSGESSAGSGHLQAATSTTPEAGVDHHHHNFLLDVRGTGIDSSPTSHMKQEIAGAIPGSSIHSKLCQVCNDNASGFHYGVWSCEGCKAFFKRSIQGPVDYICPATNTCTIDKHRRKSCQACRLRRCYEVGMNKGSQRKERKSSGATSGLKGKRCRADSSDSAINSTNNGPQSVKAAKRSRSASILEALQKADLPVLESYHNHSLPATRVHLLNTLIKLADRELVYLINWAKHVPGYTCLTLSDQVHLIECCWMELLLLNCAFRSMEYEGRTLVFAPDFHLERQQWAVTGMGDVLEQVSAVSEQMVLHSLNKEELLLLQATVLVNAEVRHMDSFVKIQDMRQVILDVLMEVAGRHQGYGSLRHAPSILLLLTHIRQAGERSITYFQRLKIEGCVTFCDLLTEMLDAHNSSGERQRLQQQHLLQQHPSQTMLQQHPQQQPSQHQSAHQHQHPQHSMAPE
uniref:Estrogen receptor n=1 Tax=Arion vulgaris TaxID=1028688 RepID=A0A0B6ZVF0_9EUPU